MTQRVVFVPAGYLFGLNSGLRSIPAINTFMAELEEHFDIDIPDTTEPPDQRDPNIHFWPQPPRPGARPPEIRQALVDGCHLVAMGWHTAEAMVALDGHRGVRSFVSLGFQPTPAMMRTAGMATMADAYQGSILRRGRAYAIVRVLFQGLPETELRRMVDEFDSNIDLDRQREYLDWLNQLDPLKDRPQVLPPSLYLHSPIDMAGARDVFLRLVPHAEVGFLESFPTRLQDAETGVEPARKTIEFIQRHSS